MSFSLSRLLAPKAPPASTQDVVTPAGRTVSVQRVAHPRARRLKLSLSERGVRLTLPPRVSRRAADAFLLAQLPWLDTQLDRYAATTTPAPWQLGCREPLPLRGAMLPLHWTQARFASASLHAHGIELALPARAGLATARRLLRDFYSAEARTDIARWLPMYLPSLPRAPQQIRLRPLASLWGALNPGGALSLDLALVLAPPRAFEYVLVHELCHLLQANHSPRYWREVEARFPDWREQRDYLHADGLRLKGELRRLLSA